MSDSQRPLRDSRALAWLRERPRITGLLASVALVLGAVAGWQWVESWKTTHAALLRSDFEQRALAVIDELNERIDALSATGPSGGAELRDAVTQMRNKIEALEIEAAGLRMRLAINDPWPTAARDAVANTLFRLDSLSEQATRPVPELSTEAFAAEEAPVEVQPPAAGTARISATPAQMKRAREIGAAYHERQKRRFAGAPFSVLPSAAGTLSEPVQ